MENKKIFVIEHCENCSTHQWNTRHQEGQYKQHAMSVAEALVGNIPGSEVVFNKVPKEHAMSDIYCQLIANEDGANPFYDVQPRIGAFEVSYNGVLLFSKCLSGVWPHYQGLAQRCAQVVQAADQGQDISMFQTTGAVVKQGRRGGNKGATMSSSNGGAQMMQQSIEPMPEQQMEEPIQQEQQQHEPVQQQQAAPVEQEQAAAPVQEKKEEAPAPVEQKQAAEPAKTTGVKAADVCNKADDLQDFETFFPAGTKSLLSKYLTKEVWDKYKDNKDASGVTFKTCVFSGIKNLDSGIGLYAGSHDSYTTFSDLFDKVIEDYHGHKKTDTHTSNMNSKGLKNVDFSPEDAKMVNSTRIRVGRNLDGYPLGPGVTKEQRLEIMTKVVKACETFDGDLKGTFYPLEGMDKATQDKLINDHFLFKEGDRFLEACNLNRDWPSGRGIFHNDAKTFLVWVNEEDQLRIISMQPGAGIAEVFDRLCRAASHIETVTKFAHDKHLGYITSCPTNLGTALRASVHINLPKLQKNKKVFNEIADKYYVQIRGIHGEHTETDDGVFDISNKRRLGRGEADLVQDMIDGVHALIDAEKAEK